LHVEERCLRVADLGFGEGVRTATCPLRLPFAFNGLRVVTVGVAAHGACVWETAHGNRVARKRHPGASQATRLQALAVTRAGDGNTAKSPGRSSAPRAPAHRLTCCTE